jgi:hypothetical protein
MTFQLNTEQASTPSSHHAVELAAAYERIQQLEGMLGECAAWFDQRSDISSEHNEDGSPRPNVEMQMMCRIDEVLS